MWFSPLDSSEDFMGRDGLRLWATVCKTVRPMLSVRCLSCLSVCPVCDMRALWPNGSTHQDETWHAGRPRPWPHYVRWRSSSPKGAYPQLSAHIRCGQMAAWIKMPLCTEPRRLCVKWAPSTSLYIFGPCLL